MANAKKDNNRVPTIIAVSKADLVTPVVVAVVPSTGALVVELG